MKQILVVCGMGVATSTVANKTIQEYLQSQGIAANVTQVKVSELAGHADSADLIVLMAVGAQVPASITCPVVKGLPFLTGVGKEELLEEIGTILKN